MRAEGAAIEHEEATIRAFVVRNKQDRFLAFVANPKTRRKFTGSLANFGWFDRRFATPVPWKVDPTLKLWERHTQGIGNVLRLLKSRDAGSTCWVISEDTKLDGQEVDLESALGEIVGGGQGTILSCIPGRLAYFNGEYESLLLAR
jgi:hypothetical protein